MAADYEFIRVDARDGVATIRLARPPLNVLHPPMMTEIVDALDVAEASAEVRTVVIAGDGGRAFSAGAEIADHDREHIEALVGRMSALLTRIEGLSLPSVAALNGLTLGGGLELALACDMIVAVPDAKLGLPEIKLASIAFPAILLLQDRLPRNVVTELLAGGEPLDATDAHRLGLVNHLLDPDDVEGSVARFAGRFARMSRPVLRLLMGSLKSARGKTLRTGFADGTRMYLDELLPLEDVTEGLAAHAQKRRPVWRHR